MHIEGKACRYCGGEITEIEPIVVRCESPISGGDLRVSKTVPTGKYTATEVVEYHHMVVGYCDRCCMGFSLDQMVNYI